MSYNYFIKLISEIFNHDIFGDVATYYELQILTYEVQVNIVGKGVFMIYFYFKSIIHKKKKC